MRHIRTAVVPALFIAALQLSSASGAAQAHQFEFNDCHFHLTNYIQEGTDIREFVKIMGNRAGRVALFGIPLQQQWSYRVVDPETSNKVRKGNYERIFNEGRRRVRQWENTHLKSGATP